MQTKLLLRESSAVTFTGLCSPSWLLFEVGLSPDYNVHHDVVFRSGRKNDSFRPAMSQNVSHLHAGVAFVTAFASDVLHCEATVNRNGTL